MHDDHAPLIERAFSLEPAELAYEIEEIEGDVPKFIRGTYYLNGPARFSRADLNYRHWLDGDGMVCALRFQSGSVHFTNRFVRSSKYSTEEEEGRFVFRTFGTAFAADKLKRRIALESPVNVSVYPYGSMLLAFGEQGLPWALDPLTLETRGEFNFGGRLNDVTPFSAHPKFDSATGEMFNFGVAFSATEPCLNIYRFDNQANLLYRRRIRLDYACSVHDFALSQRYAVFYLSPYVLDMGTMVSEGRTLMDALSWEPERGSRLLVVERVTGEAVASIPIGERYCLHLINCFEEGRRLTVDVVELDRPIYDQYQPLPELFTDVCAGRPVRLVVDLQKRDLAERGEIDYCLAPDFPAIDAQRATQPYNDCWMLGLSATGKPGRKFFDQLVHADWESAKARDMYHAAPLNYLGGEPIFIGDSGNQANGVVICQIFDAEHSRSAFAIFDAFNVARGPVATLRLKAPIPLLFHASFVKENETA